MFCAACGTKLSDGEKFCHSCGEPSEVTNAQSQIEKCKCNHCDQHIEFEGKMAGTTIQCPSCGVDTQLYISQKALEPVSPATSVKINAPVSEIPKLSEAKSPPPNIQTASTPAQSVRSRGIYIILGILLGLLGIHDFYGGRYKEGAIILCLTYSGLLIFHKFTVPPEFFLGSFFVGLKYSLPILISFILVVVEICTIKKDGEGRPFTM